MEILEIFGQNSCLLRYFWAFLQNIYPCQPKENNPEPSETGKVEVSQFVKVETQNTKDERADTERSIKKGRVEYLSLKTKAFL